MSPDLNLKEFGIYKTVLRQSEYCDYFQLLHVGFSLRLLLFIFMICEQDFGVLKDSVITFLLYSCLYCLEAIGYSFLNVIFSFKFDDVLDFSEKFGKKS